MIKTVLFQTIQFSISTDFSSILSIDRNLSGASTRDQNGPGSDGNKGVLHIPQMFSITGASSSDFLVAYPGHSWGVYSTALANWDIEHRILSYFYTCC